MKVTCITNSGKDLSKKALSIGNTTSTKFDLEVGHSYFVYGIHIYNDLLSYLLIGKDEDLPSWYPAELFYVSDNLLPIEWYFNYLGYKEDTNVSAIWGYKELVIDESHHDGLNDRETEAIRIFLKRKQELEEFFDM